MRTGFRLSVNTDILLIRSKNHKQRIVRRTRKMIKTDPWTGGTNEEYETQHFGFGAQRFKIAVRQMIEQKIRSCVKEMEQFLQNSTKLNDEDKQALTNSCDKLVHIYCNRAGSSLAIVDEEIENLLEVPHNVLLPEDEVQLEQTSDEDFEKLNQEVASLRMRVEQSALIAALLNSEEEELKSVVNVCEIAKKDMEVLDVLQKNLEGSENSKSILNGVQFLSASIPFTEERDEQYIYES